ncbi:MAG: ATP synthase F1 subunit gamma [Muribaculaceae bacterium]|nr:ATP synthase F1 subunit gamma [Muribaculaceae bacterium]
MATLRELKTRIGSVASSEKITGAMKMISSAKVHKFERSLKELLPYKNQIQTIMGHILSSGVDFHSPLIIDREVKHIGVVVYGSDDGLCGAYNLNIFKQLLVELNSLRDKYGKEVKITLYPVGKKIYKACWRLHGETGIDIETVAGVDSKMAGNVVEEFTHGLRDKFSAGEMDLIEVVYMRYYSISRQRLAVDQLFPVKADQLLASTSEATDENQLYIFEPDANEIFNAVLPMFVLSTMQEITIENRASEQAARVMAMQSANDNARKLQEQLQLEYNKLRQQSITTELLDILGGQVDR